jgi:hypothetical protein
LRFRYIAPLSFSPVSLLLSPAAADAASAIAIADLGRHFDITPPTLIAAAPPRYSATPQPPAADY